MKIKIVSLTWYQVRARGGITYKEYTRRVNISNSLKEYYQRQRIIKEQVYVAPIPAKKRRIRQQLAYSFKGDSAPYYLSIKAVTINPEITKSGMLQEIFKAKNQVEREYNNNFKLEKDYSAVEYTALAPNEEPKLNDYKLHIEIFIVITGHQVFTDSYTT